MLAARASWEPLTRSRAWFCLVVVGLSLAPSAALGQADLSEIVGGCEGTSIGSLPAHASAQRLDERIGDYLAEEVRSRGIPGLTAAVVLDGEVVYIGAFGVRRLGSAEALTPEHVFHFASVSKPFVADRGTS